MISADLTGRRVLVTGGASGIGLAAVTLFARCGARVALAHLPDDPRGPAEAARLKGEGLAVEAVPGDVARAGEAEAFVTAAIDRMGGLDVLLNNAGTPAAAVNPIAFDDLDAMDETFWDTVLSTNLVGPFRCARAAAPALRASRGAIVNTASVAGLNKPGSSIAYGASKAGLVNLTRNLARALAPEVRVNAVAPGLVDSPWTRDWPQPRKDALIARSLIPRMAAPDEIAEAMLYLAAGAAFVTGHTLVVDGGEA